MRMVHKQKKPIKIMGDEEKVSKNTNRKKKKKQPKNKMCSKYVAN